MSSLFANPGFCRGGKIDFPYPFFIREKTEKLQKWCECAIFVLVPTSERTIAEGDNEMPWVIGPLCIDHMDTACVDVCPVDCIHLYTGDDPNIPINQLLIDPEVCIDCAVCEPACPWEAIYEDTEVPPEFDQYIEFNTRIAGQEQIENPKYSKAQPTIEETAKNRKRWLEKLRHSS